jgi:hypothetical protein
MHIIVSMFLTMLYILSQNLLFRKNKALTYLNKIFYLCAIYSKRNFRFFQYYV